MQTTEIGFTNALARGQLYKVLSKSFLYPTAGLSHGIGKEEFIQVLSQFRAFNPAGSELQSIIDDLRELLKDQSQAISRENLEEEYNRLFAHLGSTNCPPYETEYGYDNVFQKTQAMADIAGFYRAYKLDVADANAERVDFISTELEFMSFLAMNEAYAYESGNRDQLDVCVDTQRLFLNDHLGRWVGVFVNILSCSTSNGFYQLIGRLTKAFFDNEATRLSITVKEVAGPNKEPEKPASPFGCDDCVVQRQDNP